MTLDGQISKHVPFSFTDIMKSKTMSLHGKKHKTYQQAKTV